jgi:hypothetical protein
MRIVMDVQIIILEFSPVILRLKATELDMKLYITKVFLIFARNSNVLGPDIALFVVKVRLTPCAPSVDSLPEFALTTLSRDRKSSFIFTTKYTVVPHKLTA